MPSTLTTLTSLIVGGIVFVVLFVILGVTLWVSIVAGGVAAVASELAGAGTQVGHRGSPRHPHRA